MGADFLDGHLLEHGGVVSILVTSSILEQFGSDQRGYLIAFDLAALIAVVGGLLWLFISPRLDADVPTPAAAAPLTNDP